MKKVILVALSTVVIWGMYSISPYKKEALSPVSLIQPTVSDIRDMTILQGTIVDPSPVRIYAEEPSMILEVLVRPGDIIQKGQPIIRLKKQGSTVNPQDIAAAALFQLEQALKTGDYSAAQAMIDGMKTTSASPSNTPVEDKVYQLYSPLDGIVLDVFCKENTQVNSLIPCLEICDPAKLLIRAQVDESMIGILSENQLCEVTIPAFSSGILTGRITSIKPYAQQTGLLSGNASAKTTVEIALFYAENLRPGYRAEVCVITDYKTQALLVPYEAIAQEQLQEYVFILENNKTVKQNILTGSELENSVEIISGLTPESVIVLNPVSVEEGVLIQYAESGSTDTIDP